MVRVAIVEDHQVMIDAFIMLMQREGDFEVIGSAGTLTEGQALVKSRPPDVLLLDICLPDGDGLSLIPEVKAISPKTKIVVLTHLSDENTLIRAIDKGVNGFLPKSCSLNELLSAIRRAAEGEIMIPPSLLRGLLMRIPREKTPIQTENRSRDRLTPRERDILNGLARGKSGAIIATELKIAPLTVRTHIRNILSKFGVHSRLEAVAFGMRNGLIEL